MNSNEMERRATVKARTVDPNDLPWATSPDQWQTWVSDQGAWIFIEKSVVDAISPSFASDKEKSFQWVGARIFEWLGKNAFKIKQRDIWKFEFADVKDTPVNLAVFNNKCFVFMPRKLETR
jgi:hypothetical protein